MGSGTYHVSQNAYPAVSGSWWQGGAFGVVAGTDMQITGFKVPIINYTTYTITSTVTYYVDGVLLGTTTFEIYNDRPNEKVFYDADVSFSANRGSTIVIRVYVGSAGNSSVYGNDPNGAGILGSIPLSGVISDVIPDAGGIYGGGVFGMECILDILYTPCWTIDGQNDGYPYPTGTDPTEFTEFEKDKNGYPKNFGVWKLDGQNDGYPWPAGYVPINARSGVLVKNVAYKNAKVLKKSAGGWEEGSKEDILDLIGYEA